MNLLPEVQDTCTNSFHHQSQYEHTYLCHEEQVEELQVVQAWNSQIQNDDAGHCLS